MTKKTWAVFAVGFAIAFGVGGYFLYGVLFPKKEVDPVKVPVDPTAVRKTVPVPEVKFTDVTASAGIKFTHFTGATGSKLLPETMGGGRGCLRL